MMNDRRRSGLPIVGDLPWGAHFCHFYEHPEELAQTSAAFIKAGLEEGEACVWLVPDGVSTASAWQLLAMHISEIDEHQKRDALEVIESREFYLVDGVFLPETAIARWTEKLNEARARGATGLRAVTSAPTAFAEHWETVCDYERRFCGLTARERFCALCAYPLAMRRAADVLDVLQAHQFATACRHGKWEIIDGASRNEGQPANDRPLHVAALSEELEKEIDSRRRVEAEKAIRERQFQALFHESDIGFALFDPICGVIEVNRKIEQIFGYTKAELCSISMRELIELITHPDDIARSHQLILELANGERDRFSVELRYFHKDGSPIWGNVTVALVKDERVPPFGICALECITERKRAEQALAQAQAELAHVSRVLTMGEMVASIAHEVNQPLAAISTYANASLRWLDQKPPNLAEARSAISHIVADSSRAHEIIQRVRGLIKKSEPQKVALDINEVICELVAWVFGELNRRKVALVLELAHDLPQIYGDRVELQQVILNLILNGAEAMSALQPEIRRELLIRSDLFQDGVTHPAVRVQIRDVGHGVDAQHLPRVFTPFFTTKPEGLGLGLSISRSIIEAHGGKLWVTSHDARGATFQFTLPLAEHAEAPFP